jgi:hypothetical protein
MATPAIIESNELIFPTELGKRTQKTVAAFSKVVVLTSDADRALAETLIKDGKELRKGIEAIRFTFTKPLDEKKQQVMNLEKELAGGLDREIVRLTGLVNSWLKELHRQAEAKKEEIRLAEEKRLSRLTSPKSIAKVQGETEAALAEVEAPKSGVRMQKMHELTDINLVPRELLMLDPAKVKTAIAAGQTHIPGLRIWEEPVRSGR